MVATLTSLLSSLTDSLDVAASTDLRDVSIPVTGGISLFDLKNEVFLSYIQNLAFLVLLRIRHTKDEGNSGDQSIREQNEEATKKLAELRLYIEKGVRPLEQRLKYEIDKVVRAADEVGQANLAKSVRASNGSGRKTANGSGNAAESDSGSNAGSGLDFSDSDSVDEMAYRPNPAALGRGSKKETRKSSKGGKASDGIYKPPRINPTAMPSAQGKEDRAARRPLKSATMDEFIATEFSAAPVAEPSIGSTIRDGGRRTQSQRERADDTERRVYEETNFVRLPAEGKKERSKNNARNRQGGFGGEEWRDLGAGLDRIDTLTKRRGGMSGKLADSRKRGWDTQDGPRGSGAQFGADFAHEKRKVMRKFR